MKRAVLYARVSYDDRDNEARNLQGQLEMYRAYCAEKDYSVVEELAEDARGASGADWDLPQLNKALDMAREGAFDVLVTRELDRLARGLAKQLVIEGEFKRHGVEVEYVLAQYDDTPEGRLNKHIRATIAEFEREKIAQRMTRGRRNVVKSGKLMLHGNRPPYGYRVEDGALLIEEDEAKTVRLIFEWYCFGDETGKRLSSRAIAERLTDAITPTWADLHNRKLKTKRAYGEWSWRQVMNILSNPTYKGEWRYGKKNRYTGQVNPVEYHLTLEVPAIISKDVWELAQAQRKANTSLPSGNVKHQYLLRGHLRCGLCGSSLCGYSTRVRDKLYQYYRCSGYMGGVANVKCDLPAFRVERVDARAWEHVKWWIMRPDLLTKALALRQEEQKDALVPFADRFAVIEELLAKHRRELERLLDLYLSGAFEKEELLERKTRLERTIESLDHERAALLEAARQTQRGLTEQQVQTIEELAAKYSSELESMGFEEKRQMIELLGLRVLAYLENGDQWVQVECVIDGPSEDLPVNVSTFQSGAQSSQAFVIGTTLRLASNEPGELFTHLLTTPTGAGLSGRSI